MKKFKGKPIYHYCHTWQMNFDLFLGWSWAEFEKYCRKEFEICIPEFSYQGGYTTMIQKGSKCRVLIWIAKKNNAAIAAHECIHATNFVFDRAGYKLDVKNDEAQAYFVTEIMQAMGF